MLENTETKSSVTCTSASKALKTPKLKIERKDTQETKPPTEKKKKKKKEIVLQKIAATFTHEEGTLLLHFTNLRANKKLF